MQRTAQAAPATFSVGDACEAFYEEDGKYYKAEIVRVIGGGKYRINYTEYSFERDLKASEIRLPPGAVQKLPPSGAANPRSALPAAFHGVSYFVVLLCCKEHDPLKYATPPDKQSTDF